MRRSLLTAALPAYVLLFVLLPAYPAPAKAHPARCVPDNLADLARRADFIVFAPRELPAGWVPAACAYPPGGREVAGLRIHFHAAYAPLSPAGALEPRIAGIAQTKAYLRVLTDKHGKPVHLRGRTARFRPWPPGVHDADGRPVHGGTLRWIERGTLIEIDSRILTKKQMLRLAESLAPLSDPTSARPAQLPDP